MTNADKQRYQESVTQLQEALTNGKKFLPIELQKQGNQILTAARQRLDLGVEHTLVALVGGTGSGKSSTFNAIAGLEFADVGVKRPTTVRTAACSWDSDATNLLDWVGVDNDRRISRDTALDGAEQEALKGLILLDLPDHDSIAVHHKDIVDKVIPLVDLLIWVVDPQKYADQALHAEYLRSMVDARASMLVVLNQIDTVRQDQQDELKADVARLLVEDGLDAVELRTISARTGQGIPELRDQIREVVAGRSMASRRLNDELLKLARLINGQVPGDVVTDLSASARAEADRYLVAAGVPALADEVQELTARDSATGTAPRLSVPSATTLAGLRNRWLDRVASPLADQWEKQIRKDTGSVEALASSLENELNKVEVPWGKVPGASLAPIIGAGVMAVILLVLGVVSLTGVFGNGAVALAILAGAAISALFCWYAYVRRTKILVKAGRDRADTVRENAAQAVIATLEHVLFDPISQTLKTHESIARQADHVISLNVKERV